MRTVYLRKPSLIALSREMIILTSQFLNTQPEIRRIYTKQTTNCSTGKMLPAVEITAQGWPN